ncbi:JAB domain-containing protein, partial [Staphylococcus aureus]|nr:JAB domain-containing protein [Staphylococcus aureus]
HNHPSGDTTPSKEDISATNRLRECGEILGIDLLDHIIIGDHTYMSMVEDGYFD